jgi:hypothetical protein
MHAILEDLSVELYAKSGGPCTEHFGEKYRNVLEIGAKNATPRGFFRFSRLQGKNLEMFSDRSIGKSL